MIGDRRSGVQLVATGAATTVARDKIAMLPTLSGRIGDVTRLTPQASGSTSPGRTTASSNIRVMARRSTARSARRPARRPHRRRSDLAGSDRADPGERRAVRCAAGQLHRRRREHRYAQRHNQLSGAIYHRFRDQDWVGTEARGQTVNPGTFKFRNTGGWASGPIMRNKWFAFGNYEERARQASALDVPRQPRRRAGRRQRHPRARVRPHDAQRVPQVELRLRYRAVQRSPRRNAGQALPDSQRLQHQQRNKVSFRYNQLDSITDVGLSGSGSALRGRAPQRHTS